MGIEMVARYQETPDAGRMIPGYQQEKEDILRALDTVGVALMLGVPARLALVPIDANTNTRQVMVEVWCPKCQQNWAELPSMANGGINAAKCYDCYIDSW